jgi:small-conductance mechanosensitive channel
VLPNRIAVYLVAAGALITAIAVPVAELDLSSTAGVIAGLASITAVVDRWLKGWQQYEQQFAVGDESRDIHEAEERLTDEISRV